MPESSKDSPANAGSARASVGNFVVALTGGIGSGKSTVARLFQANGVAVIDSDALSHQLTAPEGKAIAAIAEHFGSEMIEADGRMNRAKMRQRVFSSATDKATLESILHPLIRAESQRALEQAFASQSPYVIVDVPLLTETAKNPDGWAKKASRILVVDCPVDVQIERVIARSKGAMTREQVLAIIEQQASRTERLALATDVIDNSGDAALLKSCVDSYHKRYLSLSSQPV